MLLESMVVLAALVGGEGPAAPPAAPALRNHEGPMAKVLEEAKASGRPVLIDFFADWCGPCKWMDKFVFTDAEVMKACNEGFVLFRVDAEKGEGVDLAKKYGIGGYPTFLTVDAAGAELDRKVGSAPKDRLLSILKDIKAGNHLKALREKAAKDPKDAWTQARLGNRLFDNRDESARDFLENAVELDPKDSQAETIEARFSLAVLDLQRDQSVDGIGEFAKKYPDSPSVVQAHQILLSIARQQQDDDAAIASLEVLAKKAPDARTRNELAWLLATNGKEFDRALALVEAALKDEPKNAAYLDTRAECLSRLGRHDEAVAEQLKAIENLDPKTSEEDRAEYEKRLEGFVKKQADAKK